MRSEGWEGQGGINYRSFFDYRRVGCWKSNLISTRKTLTLTYLSWLNWFRKRSKLYSNYHLYKIPYIYIDSIEKLEYAREGHISADEFWLCVDSRSSSSTRNKIVSSILLKSRKRDLTYMFTTQSIDMIDKRVRKVIDFTAYTTLNRIETVGRTLIFRGGYPKESMYMKDFRFYTNAVFQMYDTREEIQMLDEDDGQPPKIVFQESPEHPPKYFDTWEDADKWAEEKFWATKEGEKLISMLILGQ